MDEILRILLIASSFYVVYCFYTQDQKEVLHREFLKRINATTKSQKFDEALDNAGLSIDSKQYNLIRYALIAIALIYGYGTYFIKGLTIDARPLALAVLIFIATSSQAYSPAMLLLKQLQKNKNRKMNSELVSFLRTYQANKRNLSYQLPLESLCNQVAENYIYIKKDLKMLARRIAEESLEDAMNWWESRFDKRHPFFQSMKNIILTTETEPDHHKSIDYLQSQSETIAGISSKIYKEKWENINTLATVFNSFPSLLSMVMIIALSVELALRTKEGIY